MSGSSGRIVAEIRPNNVPFILKLYMLSGQAKAAAFRPFPKRADWPHYHLAEGLDHDLLTPHKLYRPHASRLPWKKNRAV
jgi:hypothetical protein